jgi:hypothetical protein
MEMAWVYVIFKLYPNEKKTSSKKKEKQLILYVRYIDYGLASAWMFDPGTSVWTLPAQGANKRLAR